MSNELYDSMPECDERKTAVERLKQEIVSNGENVDELLWMTIIAYQNYPFYTVSGLAFSYTVKRNRTGTYGGELLVSRKEESKTLTKSSVLLAFHKVLEKMEQNKKEQEDETLFLFPAEFRGPKAIGQIFGISYIYSLFQEFGLVKEAPKKRKA